MNCGISDKERIEKLEKIVLELGSEVKELKSKNAELEQKCTKIDSLEKEIQSLKFLATRNEELEKEGLTVFQEKFKDYNSQLEIKFNLLESKFREFSNISHSNKQSEESDTQKKELTKDQRLILSIKEFTQNPVELKYKEIITDSIIDFTLPHIFTIVTTIDNSTLLIYGTKKTNSLVFYSFDTFKNVHVIQDAHKDNILSIRHYLDFNVESQDNANTSANKRDLIITSSSDKHIKIWSISNENYVNLYDITSNFFSSDLTSGNIICNKINAGKTEQTPEYIIITSDYNDCIRSFDMITGNYLKCFGEKQENKPMDCYVFSEGNDNYIIEGGDGLFSYNYNEGFYHNYQVDGNNINPSCVNVFLINGIINLIVSEYYGGCVSIFDFHKGILIKTVKAGVKINCFTMWNGSYILGTCFGKVIVFNVKTGEVTDGILIDEKAFINCVGKVHCKYGECLVVSDGNGVLRILKKINE